MCLGLFIIYLMNLALLTTALTRQSTKRASSFSSFKYLEKSKSLQYSVSALKMSKRSASSEKNAGDSDSNGEDKSQKKAKKSPSPKKTAAAGGESPRAPASLVRNIRPLKYSPAGFKATRGRAMTAREIDISNDEGECVIVWMSRDQRT